MIWCHLHKELSAKHGITNYDMKEYETEYDWLMSISQEDLIESLRCDGRKQAATRQLRNKQHSTMCASVAHLDGKKGDKEGVCPAPCQSCRSGRTCACMWVLPPSSTSHCF